MRREIAIQLGRSAIALLALCAASATVSAESLTMVAYNVESGGAEVATVAAEIEQLAGVDIWGFSELAGWSWLEEFRRAARRAGGVEYSAIIGSTGEYDDPARADDLLGLLYNRERLKLLGQRQLHAMNDWAHRSPLVAEFELKRGTTFIVVLNHLASGDTKLRIQQSWQLREWAFFRSRPLVMLGDFNYRWRIGESDDSPPRGFDALTRGGVLSWVRPAVLTNTFCGGAPVSVFDFVFVNAAARQWNGRSDVIEAECAKSSPKVSDHRPLRVVFEVPDHPERTATRGRLGRVGASAGPAQAK